MKRDTNHIMERLGEAFDIVVDVMNHEPVTKAEWRKLDTIAGKLENLIFNIYDKENHL